MNFESPYQ